MGAVVAGAMSANAALTFTSEASFVAALPAGYFYNNFSSVVSGSVNPSLLFSGGTPLMSYTLTSPGSNPGVWGTTLSDRAVGNNYAPNSLITASISPGAYWVGANFWNVDINENRVAGTVVINFSDGTVANVTSTTTGALGFFGVHSDVPITSFTVQGGQFFSMDNLYTAVPEPTTMIAGALLLLPFGASTFRFFRKNRTA